MKIKAIISDCDGVLTDGTFVFDTNGVPSRRFNFRDIMGFSLAQQAGLRVAIVSSEPLPPGLLRKLDVRRFYPQVQHPPRVYQNSRDKIAVLEELHRDWGTPLEEIAYIGDDVNDLKALQIVGCPIAPADGVAAVRRKAKWVTKSKGGEGVIREAVERILEIRKRQ